MKIRYKIGKTGPETTYSEDRITEVSSFEDFCSWLWSLGCGDDRESPQLKQRWVDAYRQLQAGQMAGWRISCSREPGTSWVEIVHDKID